jgi:hypothetical protein
MSASTFVSRLPADNAARNTAIEAAWRQYLAARDRVDQTRRFEDGIAAGHAWRAFVDSFTEVA